MARKRQSLLFIVMLLLASCRKDAPIIKAKPVEDPFAKYNICLDQVMHKSPSFGNVYKGAIIDHCPGNANRLNKDTFLYYHPSINPSNPSQVCYMRVNSLTATGELWTYDLCEGKGRKIADNIYYRPNWSSTGWIIYTGLDKNLWKVKDNGDSITQLTYGGHHNAPKWSPDGTKYIWEDISSGISKIKIAYADGTVIKQATPMDSYAWLNENEIVYARESAPVKMRKYSLINSSISDICPVNVRATSMMDIKWDQLFAYVDTDIGLYKVDLKTTTTQLIDSTYATYNGIFHNFAGDKIILQRSLVDINTGNNCIFYNYSYLSIMNADGSGERKLILP